MTRWLTGLLVAIFALLLPHAAQATDTHPDIVGGQPASITEAPWQVALVSTAEPDNGKAQFCGGSIVGPDWVLTAAHCVTPLPQPSAIAVLAGSTTLSGATRTPVAEIRVHPSWDETTQRHDVALLRSATPLPLNGETMAAVALPTGQDPMAWPAAGQSASISGWGDTLLSFPDALHKAAVQILTSANDPVCGLYGALYDPATMLCAGFVNGAVDTCQGDSGGPLVVDVLGSAVLAGITSWGKDCAEAGYPGVYTRVTGYTAWLTSQTGLWAQLSLSPSAVSFGNVTVGYSAMADVTISNVGSAPLPVGQPTLFGTDASRFFVNTSTCLGYLPASGTCTVSVVFAPTSKGPRSASLHIAGSQVALTGQAFPTAPAAITGLRSQAKKKRVRLTWSPSPEATRYTVSVKGANPQRKRIVRKASVTGPSATLRASFRRTFTACVTAWNETGPSPATCRTFRRK